ncbi:hypothetical protein [Sphingomonas rubra]|uniref:Uncharacterized protein n=1 Tax=Sphingomonas rubra TaxID=634430 RepID=A0A1I5RAU8_9SPHN|nr:hypothetical protein [Sphingomonas rubra]SFP55652.1 hypothetical protein SAMN04488241_103130 [Sphingomonas rubra]
MPVTDPDQNPCSRRWLIAALRALDKEGDLVAAAYVSMAIDVVNKRINCRSSSASTLNIVD